MKTALMVICLLLLSQLAANELNYISADIANVREKNTSDARILTKLFINTPITVEKTDGEWAYISSFTVKNKKIVKLGGWIHKSLIHKEKLTVDGILKSLDTATTIVQKEHFADRLVALSPDQKESWLTYKKHVTDTAKLKWAESNLSGIIDLYIAIKYSSYNYDHLKEVVLLVGYIDTTGEFHSVLTPQFNEEQEGNPSPSNFTPDTSDLYSAANKDRLHAFLEDVRIRTQSLRWYTFPSGETKTKLIEGTPFYSKVDSNNLIIMGKTPEDFSDVSYKFYYSSPLTINPMSGITDFSVMKPLVNDSLRTVARCRYHYEDAGWDLPMTIKSTLTRKIVNSGYKHITINWFDTGDKSNTTTQYLLNSNNSIEWRIHGMGKDDYSVWLTNQIADNKNTFCILKPINTTCDCTCSYDQIGFISFYSGKVQSATIAAWGGGS